MDKKFTLLSNENSSVFFLLMLQRNDDGKMKEFSDNSRNVIHIFPPSSSAFQTPQLAGCSVAPSSDEGSTSCRAIRETRKKGHQLYHIRSTLRGSVFIKLQEISFVGVPRYFKVETLAEVWLKHPCCRLMNIAGFELNFFCQLACVGNLILEALLRLFWSSY